LVAATVDDVGSTIAQQIESEERRLAELRTRKECELTRLEDALAHGWDTKTHRKAAESVDAEILELERRLRGLSRRAILEKRDELRLHAAEGEQRAAAELAEYKRLRAEYEAAALLLDELAPQLDRAVDCRDNSAIAAGRRAEALQAFCVTNAVAIAHAEELESGRLRA
jgi:hypothetical protein